MPNNEKVFTVQPRFRIGDLPTGWALVDGIFRLGDNVPLYASEFRDAYLSTAWGNEPLLAGAISTWLEKAQTVNWKVTGGKIQANYYANLYHNADGGAGWTYHEGVSALDYLTTDKGSLEELGRASLTPAVVNELQMFYRDFKGKSNESVNYSKLETLISKATTGRVTDIQHLDSTRVVKAGMPGMRWRYFPDYRDPISIPDDNLIQMNSVPSGRDRFVGFGHCALSRLIDAKQLMVGYLSYHRQEIGDLPPELIAIVNGLSSTTFHDALQKYKKDKEAANLDEYGKIFWLGSDDPSTPVSIELRSLVTPGKSFSYQNMIEWWAKLVALNTGESVGEYWLIQHAGATRAVESVQAFKAKSKGVAKYLQEKERRYNLDIMPYGVRFEYDNKDDDQDRARAEILASKISNLKNLASIGVDREDPIYTTEELRELAIHWEIIPPEISGEDVPTVLGAMLKELWDDDTWVLTSTGEAYKLQPALKEREATSAEFVYNVLQDVYLNGNIKHKHLQDVKL